MTLYFEDFQVGQSHQFGSRTITREEIIAFARQFDPQPFHLDDEAARKSIFGGLVASGWHTTALCMRMIVDDAQSRGGGSLGSPGAEEIRWLKPVRPGDTLSVRSEVVATIPSRSKPDRGLVKTRYSLRNQHGDETMRMIAMGFFRRRRPTESGH